MRRQPRHLLFAVPAVPAVLAAFLACAGPEDIAPDPTDPLLAITSPERGTLSPASAIVVSGTATDADSGIEEVTVNGVVAELTGDTFRAEISLAPGTNMIETIARDRSGNQAVDIRAALHGELAAPGPVANAVSVRLGRETLRAVGQTAANALLATDFTPTLASVNPVMDKGGSCLGVRADVTSIDFATAAIDIVPTSRELTVNASIENLAVGVHLDYDIACIGGRRDIVSTADRVELTVSIEAGVSGGAFIFDTTAVDVSLANVDLGLGGLPTALINLIVGDIEEKIAAALEDVLVAEIEPQLQSAFDQLTASRTVSVLDRELTVSIEPSSLRLSDQAIELTTTSHIVADGATSTGYVASPRAVPGLSGELAVAIADDTLNQALGTLWASGALSREIPLAGDSGADLGAGIADSVAIDALLPPIINFDASGAGQIEIADLIVRLAREGSAVTELAVSAKLEITISTEAGGVVMSAGQPTLVITRLTTDGFLTESDLNILSAFLENYLHGDLDALVGEIPLPAFAGTTVSALESSAGGGYLTLEAALTIGAGE